ncbi:MAG: PIN domain-containing protein [Chloroflexota bacterium]|nr:PIN domain-containing protein [Chloroflexota bacterium]
MPDRNFIDTNILVYAYDSADPAKQQQARHILRSGITEETAVLSAQVLGEFFTVATSRIAEPLTAEEAEDVIRTLSVLPVVEIDLRLVLHATDIHRLYGINYWDSLIVAAAQRTGCTQILTEDLNAGQSYQDVLAVNPFSENVQ